MCRWMGSHFHDWIDYWGHIFTRVTRMGLGFFGVTKYFIYSWQTYQDVCTVGEN